MTTQTSFRPSHILPTTLYLVLMSVLISLSFTIAVIAAPKQNEISGIITASGVVLLNSDCFVNGDLCNYSISGEFAGEPENGVFQGSYFVDPASVTTIDPGTVCYNFTGVVTTTLELPRNSELVLAINGTTCIDAEGTETITGEFEVLSGTKKYKKLRDSGIITGMSSLNSQLVLELS